MTAWLRSRWDRFTVNLSWVIPIRICFNASSPALGLTDSGAAPVVQAAVGVKYNCRFPDRSPHRPLIDDRLAPLFTSST